MFLVNLYPTYAAPLHGSSINFNLLATCSAIVSPKSGTHVWKQLKLPDGLRYLIGPELKLWIVSLKFQLKMGNCCLFATFITPSTFFSPIRGLLSIKCSLHILKILKLAVYPHYPCCSHNPQLEGRLPSKNITTHLHLQVRLIKNPNKLVIKQNRLQMRINRNLFQSVLFHFT
jgi:hypothetical protein